MSDRVLVLRDAVVKITQMLSGKSVKVTQRGVSAYVKSDHKGRPIVVNLPYLPDNATEELCCAIQGFLDHEVAHILFSDFNLIGESVKGGFKGMLNILEDARIEKAMAKRFSGCSSNLSVTGKFFLDKYTTPTLNEAMAAGDTNKVIGVLMVPMIRAMSGQFVFQEYMRDKMSTMQPVYDKIADLEERIEAAASTKDCLDLAKEIDSRLRDGKPKGEGKGGKGKDPDDEGEGSSSSSTSSASCKGKKSKKPPKAGKGKGKLEEKDEEGEEEKTPSKGKGKSKDEEKKEEGEAGESEEKEGGEADDGADPEAEEEGAPSEEGEGEPVADPEEDEDEPAADEGEDEGDMTVAEDEGEEGGEDEGEPEELIEADEADGGSEDGELGVSAMVMAEIDKENANGFDEKMSSTITNDAAAAAAAADYLIYTKDDDVVEPLKVGRGFLPEMFTQMADKVDHMVGPLQKDLERAIAARSVSQWENGRRSGRMHSANLSRLAVGDDRVFRRKHASTSKDVAVELVIDASGSMGGAKIHLATQAAYALSQVLERIGIKHEVICFTTGSGGSHSEISEESRKIGRGFSRVESLYMPILKTFEERLTAQTRDRFGWLPHSNILRNNVDGECIEVAARRLKMRRETGKVMIVLSDGAPSAAGDHRALDKHLREMVQTVTKSGVNVVGIGIQTTSVERYYPKNVVINDVDELPDRVIKELRHLLVQ